MCVFGGPPRQLLAITQMPMHVLLLYCMPHLQEYRIHNCELLFKEDITVDDLIDIIEGNRRYIKCLYVYNKVGWCGTTAVGCRAWMVQVCLAGGSCQAGPFFVRAQGAAEDASPGI